MVKKVALLGLMVLAGAGVAGCGSNPDQAQDAVSVVETGTGAGTVTKLSKGSDGRDSYAEVQMKLSDGRTVTCVRFETNRAGGLSCDWDNAK